MRGVLTQNEINKMLYESAKYLPSLVNIYRNTGGDNEAGGETAGKDLIGSNVPARLAPGGQTPILRAIAERQSIDFPWTLTLPANTDCEPQDEIVWKTRRFVVVESMERDYEVTRRLLCDEIQD